MATAEEVALLRRTVEALQRDVTRLSDQEEIRKLQYKYGYYLDKCLYEEVASLYSDHPDTYVQFLGGRYKGKEGVRRLYIGRFARVFVNGRNGPVHGFLLDHPQMQGIVDVDYGPDQQPLEQSQKIQDGQQEQQMQQEQNHQEQDAEQEQPQIPAAVPAAATLPPPARAKARFRSLMQAGVHASQAGKHPRGVTQWWEGGVYENEYIKDGGPDGRSGWRILRLRYYPFWHGDFEHGWAYKVAGFVPFPTRTYPEDEGGPDEVFAEEHRMLWPDTRVVPFHYDHPVTGLPVREDDLRAPVYGEPTEGSKPALKLE